MQTSAHTSPCSHAKRDTSFNCFFLKTTVDCCGYTLSLSLSTASIRNVPLIFFQTKEFVIAFLSFEVRSWNTSHICVQLTATTCSCYCHLPCFFYNKMFSRPPAWKIEAISGCMYRTHATFLQMTVIIISFSLWITIRQEFIYLFIYLRLYLQNYKKYTSPKRCCQRRTDSWII